MALSGCNDVAIFDDVASGTGGGNVSSISFNGINTITNVTDTTATINWTHVVGASTYQIFSVTASTLSFISVVTAPTSSYLLTGLSSSASLQFRVRAYDSSGDGDTNTKNVSITTNGAPTAPSGLALQSPATTPAFDDTPTITVSGVKNGDTVKLFSDSSCSTQIGSAVATGSSVDITSSSISGANTFYANSTKTSASACSSASVAYTATTCPTGYIVVPSLAAVNAPSDFCVMKYEAKNSGGTAVSTETGAPWVSITQVNAKTECTDLGANYDLISNPEWMAIARNVENVPSNWTNGAIGDGCLKLGNVGATSACTGGDSGYNGADPESGAGRNALASLTLDNGEVIWDLSGNVWEWVDWTLGGALSTNMTQAQKASQGGTPVASWLEYTLLDDFPANSPAISLLPDNPTFNASDGMGRYYAGASGGAALRGGRWSDGTDAGAFALYLVSSSGSSYTNVGFRCVLRLP